MPLVVDPRLTSIRIRTFAQGLLARLAHDLEIACRDVTGTADARGPDAGTGRIEIPIGRMEVAGTFKDGKVNPEGLSSGDRSDCLRKMRKEVFHADESAVLRVSADLEGGRARVTIVPPHGLTVERTLALRPLQAPGGGTRIAGSLELSLAALGSNPIKGPMNAFRVKDVIEVLFDVVFVED